MARGEGRSAAVGLGWEWNGIPGARPARLPPPGGVGGGFQFRLATRDPI